MMSGLSFAMKSAIIAVAKRTMTIASPETANLFLANWRVTTLPYVSGMSRSGRGSSFITNSGIDYSVEKIRKKNPGESQKRAQREDRHDKRIITLQNRLISEQSHARYRKQ